MTELYRPKDCTTSIGGKRISGFPEGSMIEIEPASDDVSETVGTQGDVAIAVIHNYLVNVKLRLLQTSKSNDDLSTLRKTMRSASADKFAATFSFSDQSGTTKVEGIAWIKKAPTKVFSNGIEAREWSLTVNTEGYDDVTGGNDFV